MYLPVHIYIYIYIYMYYIQRERCLHIYIYILNGLLRLGHAHPGPHVLRLRRSHDNDINIDDIINNTNNDININNIDIDSCNIN